MYIYIYWASLVAQTVKSPPAIITFKEYMSITEHIFFYSRLNICTEKSPLFFILKLAPLYNQIILINKISKTQKIMSS